MLIVKNGIDWYLATKNYTLQPAFPFYYTLKNGTKIHVKRRERTQILLDKNGMPSYLFNGVQPDGQPPPGQERFTFYRRTTHKIIQYPLKVTCK